MRRAHAARSATRVSEVTVSLSLYTKHCEATRRQSRAKRNG